MIRGAFASYVWTSFNLLTICCRSKLSMPSTASWCWWIKTLVLDLKNSRGYRSEMKCMSMFFFDEWYLSFLPNLVFVFVYKMDMVTSMKALNKTVEASQLTSDLGGTFTYSHTDWLQFHQVLDIHSHPTIALINSGVSRRFRGDCCSTTVLPLVMTQYPPTHPNIHFVCCSLMPHVA